MLGRYIFKKKDRRRETKSERSPFKAKWEGETRENARIAFIRNVSLDV